MIKKFFILFSFLFLFYSIFASDTIYIYSSLDLFINEVCTITNQDGIYTYNNNWGDQLVPDVTLFYGPKEAYEAVVMFNAKSITVTVVNVYGSPVSCTYTTASVGVRIYRNRESFTW